MTYEFICRTWVPRRWPKALAALLLLTTVAVLRFLGLGRWVSAGTSAPERADLLVALGGDDGARVRKVAALVQGGYAPTVLITGLDGSPADTRRHYLEWRARLLVEAGVPPQRLVFEGTANNSYQEAIATLALMRARGWKTVLVVSDPPHMRRLNSRVRQLNAQVTDCYEPGFKNVYYKRESCCGWAGFFRFSAAKTRLCASERREIPLIGCVDGLIRI
jgi:uncharacterized SAM-binding protein YcdF (DUF218 family)